MRRIATLCLILLLTACSSGPLWQARQDGAPRRMLDPDSIVDPVPRADPITAAGNVSPYEVNGRRYEVMADFRGFHQRGIASWYGTKFHGRKTSNGEIYSLYGMTAAHTTLPIPVYVEVTNLENGRKAIVRVNDRGPFHGGRIIDLSYAAAVKLGYADKGTALVEIRVIDPDNRGLAGAPSPGEQYFLQVGAFGAPASAQNLQARLTRLQPHPVQISRSEGKPVLHRVRIGPFADFLEARRVGLELQKTQALEPHIVSTRADEADPYKHHQ